MRRATSLLRLPLIASVLGFAGLLGYSSLHARDPVDEAARERSLGLLWAVDAKLNEDLLEARAGRVGHYDQLVRDVKELWALHRDLSSGLGPGTRRRELKDGLARAEQLLREKEAVLEQLKARHAVLRNSRQYFPSLVSALQERLRGQPGGAPLEARLLDLLRVMLVFDISSARDASANVRAAIEGLGSVRPLASTLGAATDLELLMDHARVIVEHEARVDRLVDQLLTLPFAEEVLGLTVVHSGYQRAALASAELRRRWLYVLGVASIVLGMAEVIWRLKRGARALEAAGAELLRANRALELERERERELGEQKTRFVSMTSHEFRTPLSTILSSSELLERYGERWDVERRSAHLGHIRASARNMTRMLEEILVIGRAEAGVLSPTPVAIELADYCEHLVETLSRPSEHQHSIRFSVEGGRRVWLDERLLTHVVGNLLDNALKYSPAGSEVTLHVRVRASECELVVSDRGIGIPAEDRERVFQSFQRGSNVGQIRGSGLGLAVVKRVVEVQNGAITVESEPGAGSRFVVTLPLERQLTEAAAAALAS